MKTDRETPTPTALPVKLTRLGRYRIIRPLSKGGMALVYEARRESLAGVAPRVAIKLILPNFANKDSFQELFINEARLGASMQHQNLVQIQDFDRDGDRFFLVMEYVEGITLRRIVALCAKHNIHIPMGVIAEVGRQTCDGLEYAHSAVDEQKRHLALVHRDIKPSNLILGSHGVVKVLDFGISKGRLMRERKGSVRGTWGYMAPEQARGDEVTPACDIFGLGAVLYEMASRRPLFYEKPPDEIKRLLMDDHPARMATQLDPSYGPLIGVLVRALQRDPRARYVRAADFGRSLSGLLPDPITARDEVTRFYEVIAALHEGRPVPRPGPRSTSNVSHSSLAPGATVDSSLSPWMAAGIIGAFVMAGAALILVGTMAITRPWQDPVASTAPPLAADEPPGPAGEGAPGEAEPPPTAVRRPPATTVGAVQAPATAPSEAAAEAEPVNVVVVRKPKPKTKPEPAAPAPPEAEPGRLTVATAQPGCEVYVDGKYIRTVPLMKHELPSGTHLVTLVAPDGRRKSFEVDVPEGGEVRKLWDFDRREFRR